jgi:hypothetical protein
MPSWNTDRLGLRQASRVVRSLIRVTAILAIGLHTAVSLAAVESPPPPAQLDFRDAETGFAFTAPSPLVIGKRRGHRGHDFVVEIHSADTSLPRAGTSKSLCGAALKTQPEEVRALDQTTLNDPEMLERQVESVRSSLTLMGRVDSVEPLDFGHGVRGVAAIAIPHFGPDHANVRQYIAIAETPAYRISLSCATTAAAIGKALPLFEALVGSLRIETTR